MLKTTVHTFRPTLQQCRCASVLSSSNFSPSSGACSPLQHDSPYIVTPASAPFTTPSNNAFHPAHIPKKTQVRLTLNELKEVLNSSKQLLQHLQQEYVEKSSFQSSMDLQQLIEQLTSEQMKLIQSLSSSSSSSSSQPQSSLGIRCGKKDDGSDDEK